MRKTNNGKRGGLLSGKLHKDGGIDAVVTETDKPVELENNEIIINRLSSQDPEPHHTFDGEKLTNKQILSKINSEKGNGVPIYKEGGTVLTIYSPDVEFKNGGEIKPFSDNETFEFNGKKYTVLMQSHNLNKKYWVKDEDGIETALLHDEIVDSFKNGGEVKKKVARRNLPLNTTYKIIDSFYTGGLSENPHVCENCGKPIANVGVVENEKGEDFEVGMDCAKTLSGIEDDMKFSDAEDDFKKSNQIRQKINKAKKDESLKITTEITYFRGDVVIEAINKNNDRYEYRIASEPQDFIEKYMPDVVKIISNKEKLGYKPKYNKIFGFDFSKIQRKGNDFQYSFDNVRFKVYDLEKTSDSGVVNSHISFDVYIDNKLIGSDTTYNQRDLETYILGVLNKYYFEKYSNMDKNNTKGYTKNMVEKNEKLHIFNKIIENVNEGYDLLAEKINSIENNDDRIEYATSICKSLGDYYSQNLKHGDVVLKATSKGGKYSLVITYYNKSYGKGFDIKEYEGSNSSSSSSVGFNGKNLIEFYRQIIMGKFDDFKVVFIDLFDFLKKGVKTLTDADQLIIDKKENKQYSNKEQLIEEFKENSIEDSDLYEKNTSISKDFQKLMSTGVTRQSVIDIAKKHGATESLDKIQKANTFKSYRKAISEFIENGKNAITEYVKNAKEGETEDAKAKRSLMGDDAFNYFNEKYLLNDFSEKYDISQSEVNEAHKIETEHIDTLERVYEHNLTPNEAVGKIVSDHLDESPNYYDPKIGLPNMEKELEEKSQLDKKYVWDYPISEIKKNITTSEITNFIENSKWTKYIGGGGIYYNVPHRTDENYHIKISIEKNVLKADLKKIDDVLDSKELYSKQFDSLKEAKEYAAFIYYFETGVYHVFELDEEKPKEEYKFTDEVKDVLAKDIKVSDVIVADNHNAGSVVSVKPYTKQDGTQMIEFTFPENSIYLPTMWQTKLLVRADKVLRVRKYGMALSPNMLKPINEYVEFADKNNIRIVADVEDDKIEFYKSLGFKIKDEVESFKMGVLT